MLVMVEVTLYPLRFVEQLINHCLVFLCLGVTVLQGGLRGDIPPAAWWDRVWLSIAFVHL